MIRECLLDVDLVAFLGVFCKATGEVATHGHFLTGRRAGAPRTCIVGWCAKVKWFGLMMLYWIKFCASTHNASSQSFSMIPCIFMVSWKLMKPQSSVLTYSGYFFVLSSSPQCGIISRKIVTLIRWKLTKLKFMQGTSCDVGACYGALLFSVFI